MTTTGPFENLTVKINTHVTTEIKALRNDLDVKLSVLTVPPVSLDATHTLMMRQYDEMRRVIATEQEKMRVFIKNWAIIMALFVFAMTIVVVSAVYVIVYMLKEPAVFESSPPVCNPYFDCVAKFFAGEFAKNTRDEWAH